MATKAATVKFKIRVAGTYYTGEVAHILVFRDNLMLWYIPKDSSDPKFSIKIKFELYTYIDMQGMAEYFYANLDKDFKLDSKYGKHSNHDKNTRNVGVSYTIN